MRVNAFDLPDLLPTLNHPRVIAALTPWVDSGKVGSTVLGRIEDQFNSTELARIRRPELFYDFTRYRPHIFRSGGRREVVLPNTTLSFVRAGQGEDLILLHCMEPHMLGQTFVESIVKVLTLMNVRSYLTVGSMYDSTPHTRPLQISGSSPNKGIREALKRQNVNDSGYQGPTSITSLISQQLNEKSIPTGTVLVHLPSYAQLEEDCTAQATIIDFLNQFLGISLESEDLKRRGQEQYAQVTQALESNPQIQDWVRYMETSFDDQPDGEADQEEPIRLSPSVEKFLRELDKGGGPS